MALGTGSTVDVDLGMVEAVLTHLRALGTPFSDMQGNPGAVNTRPDGMRAVFVQDPNGYWFEINDFR